MRPRQLAPVVSPSGPRKDPQGKVQEQEAGAGGQLRITGGGKQRRAALHETMDDLTGHQRQVLIPPTWSGKRAVTYDRDGVTLSLTVRNDSGVNFGATTAPGEWDMTVMEAEPVITGKRRA